MCDALSHWTRKKCDSPENQGVRCTFLLHPLFGLSFDGCGDGDDDDDDEVGFAICLFDEFAM